MRQKLKSFGIALMMLLTMLAATGCGSKAEASDSSTVSADIVASLQSTQEGLLQTLAALSDQDIAAYLEQSDDAFTISAMQAWSDNKDDLGAYVGIKSVEVVLNDDGTYVATADVEYEQADATVVMNIDVSTGYIVPSYMTMEVQYTMGQQMKMAGLNTIMGIGIVFLVLLFLSFLISLFKYIGKIGNKPEQTKKEAPMAAPVAAPAPVVEEELVDDTELVAVIAAAIAASENTSTDSFVVRSIRRKPNNKWQRA